MGPRPVYNLSVDRQPEYYANGILVHNCLASCYSGLAAHHAAPRWGQAALTTGSYGFAAGEQPDVPKGTQVISRRKHKFFNEVGIDPFAAKRAQVAEEKDAMRLTREALRLVRKRGMLDEGEGQAANAPVRPTPPQAEPGH